MLYRIETELDQITEINFDQMDADILTVGIITMADLRCHNDFFNFSEYALMECESGSESFRSSVDVYDLYSFGIINIVNVDDVLGERDRIGFFIKKNLFLLVDVIDKDKSTEALFDFAVHRIKPCNLTLERIIYSIFEGLLYNDNKSLEVIEFEISSFEEEVMNYKTDKKFTAKMLLMKKKLLLLHNYYEQLIDIGEELQENKNDIFDKKGIRYFKLFTAKVTRISLTVQRLRENIVQIREAYQANIDLNLNGVMKMFTVVTTIFLPLTLIVGWYGMNFTTMPELTWRYGYIGVIVLSVIVVIFCFWLFKKKKLL